MRRWSALFSGPTTSPSSSASARSSNDLHDRHRGPANPPAGLRKFFRALQARAARPPSLLPDSYTHYYKNEFPRRYHQHAPMIPARGSGERLVFEPYTKEVYRRPQWSADHALQPIAGWARATTRSRHPARPRKSRSSPCPRLLYGGGRTDRNTYQERGPPTRPGGPGEIAERPARHLRLLGQFHQPPRPSPNSWALRRILAI